MDLDDIIKWHLQQADQLLPVDEKLYEFHKECAETIEKLRKGRDALISCVADLLTKVKFQ